MILNPFSDLNKKVETEVKRAYDAGVAKGYELGYKMGKIERSNRGFIIGNNENRMMLDGIVNAQLIKILTDKGVNDGSSL